VQLQLIQAPDGTASLGDLTVIPCRLSSAASGNNFQPVPYAPDDPGYDRTLAKLNGTYAGPDLIRKEDDPTPTPDVTSTPEHSPGPTSTPATAAPTDTAPSPTAPPVTDPPASAAPTAPPPSP